ncbi:hypothetical protein TrRE_jg567 [Triparma retinervis]|uniref:Tyrosine-protein kinase ephrin type A/B receptor-like domain-containing protein n=1 Tax=Triparma retinervis TaxID=2557542 RepID=A0A9W6ZB45_9STRA|nr:hypothetical protein TrRE_jg567 [Triparma retinervis]
MKFYDTTTEPTRLPSLGEREQTLRQNLPLRGKLTDGNERDMKGPIIMEGVKKWSGGLAFLSILSILSLLSLLVMGGYPAGALLEKGHVGKVLPPSSTSSQVHTHLPSQRSLFQAIVNIGASAVLDFRGTEARFDTLHNEEGVCHPTTQDPEPTTLWEDGTLAATPGRVLDALHTFLSHFSDLASDVSLEIASGNGDDIYNDGGTITIHNTCPSPYSSNTPNQGSALDTSGTVNGNKYSYSDNQCFDACPPPTLPTDGQACIGCESGEYVNTELKECFPCEQGKFQPESNQDSCIPCPDGQTGLTFGAKSLEEASCIACLCPVGTRCDPTDNKNCIPCLAGTHASLFGSEQCTECPKGYVSGQEDAFCSPCSEGFFSNHDNTVCLPCPPGTFSGLASTKCTDCEIGKFASGQNNKFCSACSEGFFSNHNNTVCLPCPPGTFSGVSANKCIACEIGKFALGHNNTGCTFCDDKDVLKGSTTAKNSSSSSSSCECEAGEYEDEDEDGSTSEGFFSNHNNTACLPCPPGTFSGVSANKCIACEIGKFALGHNNTGCTFCDDKDVLKGSTTAKNSSSSPSSCKCEAGEYEDEDEDGSTRSCELVLEGMSREVNGCWRSRVRVFYKIP